MLFSTNDRYSYAVSPLVETICQLRFPAILSINAKQPVDFQEALRDDFPRYSEQEENIPAQQGGKPRTITNYNFVSADARWKINLTETFVALSTIGYTDWETFAAKLDRTLEQFIRIYRPSFFERIGLRYINAVSRARLGLEGTPWNELISHTFLGVLADEDVDETKAHRATLDTEMDLGDGFGMKLHTGPGLLNGGKTDKEPKFIIDGDFWAAGNIDMKRIPSTLVTLHDYSVRLFNASLTRELRDAMGSEPK